jgi:chorismate-pyruvate lyase
MSIDAELPRSTRIGRLAFDPTAGWFIAQDQRPAELSDVRFDQLSPFLRAMLVIDGTVTKILEAYQCEPVEVHRLTQIKEPLASPDPWLAAPVGAATAHRFVMLVGRHSDRLYAFAESRILLERLSPSMRDGLDTDSGGLGKILLKQEAETRREGLWFGIETRRDLPAVVAARSDGEFVTRAYRVIAKGEPIMMITERFPADL